LTAGITEITIDRDVKILGVTGYGNSQIQQFNGFS
jgi:hypothetical protein